ncbi:ATP-dependent Clp protease ATP-binding subunit ClpA [Gammaproteobacteria bacterium]|nr:ATP-dependent Clp protease ATP-binding subunit ClpA [Gammaproteobacteria bacterium]
MFSKNLEVTLNTAFTYAKKNRHEFVTVEHLLFALLDNSHALEILLSCNVNLDRLKLDLKDFLDKTLLSYGTGSSHEIQPNLGFQRVLQRAIMQVQAEGKSEVTGANVLAALFNEQDSQAVTFLMREKVSRIDVLNHISSSISKDFPQQEQEIDERFIGPAISEPQSADGAIEKYTVCLNEMCRQGKIDPVIGRTFEISRMMEVLSCRRKNNPLVVGESGVGKTALAEGLAWKIVNQEAPKQLEGYNIYMLDLGMLLAGTKYRGDFEKRFKSLLNEIRTLKKSVLFIDEIHTIIGAGAASGGALDAANLIKPLLARGEIKVVGATTFSEYRNLFEKDKALSRRFQKIDIKEPSAAQTVEIIRGVKGLYEQHHKVLLSDEVIKCAVDLSCKYLRDRFLPDKAFDVIDEAGAFENMRPDRDHQQVITLTNANIESCVARLAQIPTRQVSRSDRDLLCSLDRNLKTMVFGQDDAITQLSQAIKLSRSGLITQQKPIGSFLFTGPTGVGKTEVAKQLASYLGVKLLRFDMSEYMERNGASQLVGAPPGYVGYEQGGLLTEAVIKNPYSVLLLDEIEKAHEDIFNLLLQVMDSGTLTDNNGRVADFRHVIVIMTSNSGAEAFEGQQMGFVANANVAKSNAHQAVAMKFRPEFRNRLDACVQFNALSDEVTLQVVDKFLMELEVALEAKDVQISFTPSTKKWLQKKGYDPKMGARPMRRLIDQKIKAPLADQLLFGQLVNGGTVKVKVAEAQLVLDILEKSHAN